MKHHPAVSNPPHQPAYLSRNNGELWRTLEGKEKKHLTTNNHDPLNQVVPKREAILQEHVV